MRHRAGNKPHFYADVFAGAVVSAAFALSSAPLAVSAGVGAGAGVEGAASAVD